MRDGVENIVTFYLATVISTASRVCFPPTPNFINRAQHAEHTMLDGALAQPALFTIGAVLVVMEFSTVLLCVANDYKAFNYALRIADVDAARQLDLETLWASAQRPTPCLAQTTPCSRRASRRCTSAAGSSRRASSCPRASTLCSAPRLRK